MPCSPRSTARCGSTGWGFYGKPSGNFPNCLHFFDINIVQTLHSLHFSTHTLNLRTYSILLVPSQIPRASLRRVFFFASVFINLSIYFSIYFSFLRVLFSSAHLPSLYLLSTFSPLLGMDRFAYLVDSAESIGSFKLYRIPPGVFI